MALFSFLLSIPYASSQAKTQSAIQKREAKQVRRYKIRDLPDAKEAMRKPGRNWLWKTGRFLVDVGTVGLLFWLPGSFHYSYRSGPTHIEVKSR